MCALDRVHGRFIGLSIGSLFNLGESYILRTALWELALKQCLQYTGLSNDTWRATQARILSNLGVGGCHKTVDHVHTSGRLSIAAPVTILGLQVGDLVPLTKWYYEIVSQPGVVMSSD